MHGISPCLWAGKLTHPLNNRRKTTPMKNTLLALSGLILLSTTLTGKAQFNYTTNNGTITITGYYGPGGAVTIPDTITGLPVRTIGGYAFDSPNGFGVTSVKIPDSVTSIGFGAFFDCYNLTSVTIPGSVTNIGNQAFDNCTSLTSVTIPNSVTSIGEATFFHCFRMTSVTISDGVTNIGNYAFWSCTNLNQVTIPGSVTSVGNNAFASCTSLTNATIPGSVANIGSSAFESSGLINVTIPGSVISITNEVFRGCSNLTSVTISNGVRRIGFGAFFGCSSLTDVTIPASVTNIWVGAFFYCTSLIAITVDTANADYSSLDGVVFNKGQTTLIIFPPGKAGSYAIPNSATSIDIAAFLGCTGLTRITIPSSLTNIGYQAFRDCTRLGGVFFNGNAPSVGSYVFEGATNVIVYHVPGTTGWGTTFAGVPTKLWNPLMQTSGPGFGVGPAGYGFNITGTTNIPIVVEACTNLANASWVALRSLNLTNGVFYFSDPYWTNYPARLYRIRSP